MKKKKNDERLTDNLQRVILQFLMGRSYVPMTLEELVERLVLPPQHLPLVTKILHQVIKEGLIEKVNQRYIVAKAKTDVVSGVLRVHARGFGFLQPENASLYTEDIFIPKHLTMNAVDGDIVEVVVNGEVISEKGPEGKVVAILERGRSHIAGIVHKVEIDGDVLAYVPLLGSEKRVVVQTDEKTTLRAGDRISMEVIDWGTKDSDTVARLTRLIGHIEDPTCDIPAAIEEYELRSEFPFPTVKEATAFGSRVLPKDLQDREDLRPLECFTIDPETAKDFDDAVSLRVDSKGHFHLGVHIADVSHYVKRGSQLDKEARLRCNSTYFPGYCLPMLPKELSDNLCSLKPNVIRLTASVFCEFDADGNLLNHRIARTFIKSAKRFTYEEAKEVLDGEKKSPHDKTLHLMVKLCHLLKRKRYERGSIEFSLPELKIITDEKGNSIKTATVTYDITHQLVEEFMLKANEIVAWHLSNIGKDLTYRIHDEPAEENMRDFSILASAFGFTLSESPTPAELQKMFDDALETPFGPYLATSFIRRMRLAVYSPENIGHYGLGLTHYCHFTSPIRRYVDLAIHRILFEQEETKETLFQIAEKCSEQERISAKAEGSVILLKKLRLLDKFYRDDPYQEYEAIITRVKPFGFSFEVLDVMLEGFLRVYDLEDDFYIFEESRMRLKGRRTGKIYAPGERIRVHLSSLDFIFSETSWYLAKTAKPTQKLTKAQKPTTQKPKTQKPRSRNRRKRK